MLGIKKEGEFKQFVLQMIKMEIQYMKILGQYAILKNEWENKK